MSRQASLRRAATLVAMAAFLGLACVSGLLPAGRSPADELQPPPPPNTTPQTPVGAADREPIAIGEGETEAETAPVETPEAEEPTPEPTPIPTVVPAAYDAPVPDGAVARLGRGEILRVAFSPDGQLLAVHSAVGMFVYRADTFELLWTQNTEHWVEDIAFGADGQTLLLMTRTYDVEESAFNALVQVWDARTGEQVRSEAFPSIDSGRLIGPDNSAFVVWQDEAPLLVVDIATGDAWEIGDDEVSLFAFSPDGSLMACEYEGNVDLWDGVAGAEIGRLDNSGGDVTKLIFSPDGSLVAAGKKNGTIAVWDTATTERVQTLAHPSERSITQLAISPDGTTLVGAPSSSGEIAAWDLATGAQLYQGSTGIGTGFGLVFSPDGSVLAQYAIDAVAMIDPATGDVLRTLDGHLSYVKQVSFSPDGSTLAVANATTDVLLWRIGAPQIDTLPYEGEDLSALGSARFSPDGDLLATGRFDGQVLLWDTDRWEIDTTLTRQDYGEATALAYSPDGRYIAAGGFFVPETGLWDLTTLPGSYAEESFILDPGTEEQLARAAGLAFSPDGSELAIAMGNDSRVIVWDTDDGEMVRAYDGEPGWDLAESVAYSPDGRTIATGFSSGTLIWDIARDRVLQTVEVHGIPYALDFSPDGRLLAVGLGSDVALWDTEAEEVVATLEDHKSWLADLAFSQDGSLLASSSNDGSVIVWDMAAYGQPDMRKTPTPTESASASATPSVTPTPR